MGHEGVEKEGVVCRMCADELKHESDTDTDSESKSSDCLTIQAIKHNKLNSDLKEGVETEEKMKELHRLKNESAENVALTKNYQETKKENYYFEDDLCDRNLQSSINSQLLSSLEADGEYFKDESVANEKVVKVQNEIQATAFESTNLLETSAEGGSMQAEACGTGKKDQWASISAESDAHFEAIAAKIMSEVVYDLELLVARLKNSDLIGREEETLMEHSSSKDALKRAHDRVMDDKRFKCMSAEGTVEDIGKVVDLKGSYEENNHVDRKTNRSCSTSSASSSSSSASSPILDSSDESLYGEEDKEYEKTKIAFKTSSMLRSEPDVDEYDDEDNKDEQRYRGEVEQTSKSAAAVETKFDWERYVQMSMERQHSPTPAWCNWSTFEQGQALEAPVLEEEKYEPVQEEHQVKEPTRVEQQVIKKGSSLEEGKNSDSAYSVDTSNEDDDDDEYDDDSDKSDNEVEKTTIVKHSCIQYCPSEESEYDFDDADVDQKVTVIHYNRSDSAPCNTSNKDLDRLKLNSSYNRSQSAPKPLQPTRINASFFSDSTNSSSFGFESIEREVEQGENGKDYNAGKLESLTEQVETTDIQVEATAGMSVDCHPIKLNLIFF